MMNICIIFKFIWFLSHTSTLFPLLTVLIDKFNLFDIHVKILTSRGQQITHGHIVDAHYYTELSIGWFYKLST